MSEGGWIEDIRAKGGESETEGEESKMEARTEGRIREERFHRGRNLRERETLF